MTKSKRKRVQIKFEKSSLTEQTHKNECDINNVVRKFTQTGQIPNRIYENPQYGEAPNSDFKEALDTVKNLQREFADLSPEKQEIFGGDFEKYGHFLTAYDEAPESFYNEPELDSDILHRDSDQNAKKTALDSSDGGSQSET